MNDEPQVDARQFGGQVSMADDHDLEPGQMAVQVNLALVRRGELQIRAGARTMTYDQDY